MVVAVARRVRDILTADEVRDLTRASNIRGAVAVATTWVVIMGSFALVAFAPNPLTIVLALIILGGRHLALAILMHEASHRSLFRSRRLNDFVGNWLCAAPGGHHLEAYRKHHQQHHVHTGTARDVDISLVRPFPVSRGSLARKFARDLLGVAGLKRAYGMLAMDFGYIEYTASVDVTPIDQTGRNFADIITTGARNLAPTVVANAAIFAALTTLGHAELFILWVASWFTTYSLFLRIRSIAEHACTADSPDPFENTRTTKATLLARLTVAPHNVAYHLEHHLLMTVPYFRLPAMRKLLDERRALEGSPYASSYLAVIRRAMTPTRFRA